MARLDVEVSDPDERLRRSGDLVLPLYSYDLTVGELDTETCDARAHAETWQDMLRLQGRGVFPAAFSAIKAPVLMLHGANDPHPGRSTEAVLRAHLPQLEYREWERCGHYPWLERAASADFLRTLHEWLSRTTGAPARVIFALMKRLLILCAAAFACGCPPEEEVVCTAIAAAGLSVGVTNEQTSQALCDATVTATEGELQRDALPQRVPPRSAPGRDLARTACARRPRGSLRRRSTTCAWSWEPGSAGTCRRSSWRSRSPRVDRRLVDEQPESPAQQRVRGRHREVVGPARREELERRVRDGDDERQSQPRQRQAVGERRAPGTGRASRGSRPRCRRATCGSPRRCPRRAASACRRASRRSRRARPTRGRRSR